MATITPDEIQRLYDKIQCLLNEIEKAKSEKKKKLEKVDYQSVVSAIPLTAGTSTVDAAVWNNLAEENRLNILQQAGQLAFNLQLIACSDGPQDPKHIMFDAFASTWLIILMVIIAIAANVILIEEIIKLWNKATGNDFAPRIEMAVSALNDIDSISNKISHLKETLYNIDESIKKTGLAKPDSLKLVQERNSANIQLQQFIKIKADGQNTAGTLSQEAIRKIHKESPAESDVLLMVLLLGALGGSIHFLSSLVKFVGNRNFKRSWVLFYIAMPFTGAGLAMIVYMLLRVGLINPTGVSSSGTAISNLNLIAIYAFSALSGLFSKTALEKLGEIFRTMFKTDEGKSKDSLGNDHKAPVK